jgi:23S rRNA (cytidine2498-2'-O)-methyltransferase
MANVDITGKMPSSAYRKLLEAIECLRFLPPKARNSFDMTVPPVVDLGASPGGWTTALRKIGAKVIAVDRSELGEDLMQDKMVQFIQGDAFSYQPPWATETDGGPLVLKRAPKGTWMVSDVIADPERVIELLDRWCGGKWAGHMIITSKFQGESTPWDAIDAAIQIATNHGYQCRVKHFFNNKNEVTLMVSERNDGTTRDDGSVEKAPNSSFLGKPMYPVTLPLE